MYIESIFLEPHWRSRKILRGVIELNIISCYEMDHKQMGSCENQLAKYIIYTRAQKVEENQFRVTGCINDRDKIGFYITVRYANCKSSYMANFLYCVLR